MSDAGGTAEAGTAEAGAPARARAQLSRYVNILHLTDLHFKATKSVNKQVERTQVHSEMLRSLEGLRKAGEEARAAGNPLEDWSPDIIAISGDIAWDGSRADYDYAESHLRELLQCTGLQPTDVVMCPGNHDRSQHDDSGSGAPADAAQSDEWLSPDTFAEGGTIIRSPFAEYVAFCERLGVMQPQGISGVEYLTGMCSFDLPARDCTVEFAVVNSAWFSGVDKSDVRKMWIGLEFIRKMWVDADGSAPDGNAHVARVGLCHHTREWLHGQENDSYSDREPTYRYFAANCQVLLHGHVHGNLEAPSRPYNTAQAFTGGATYAGKRYRNNFSLLQLNFDDHSIRRRGFEYDPRKPAWVEDEDAAGTYDLGLEGQEAEPDESVSDLAGDWLSVFWQEDLASDRKPIMTVSLVPEGEGVDSGSWFKTPDWEDSEPLAARPADVETRLSMKGKLEKGYFTGSWRDPFGVRGEGTGARFGAFQLKVYGSGTEMVGRWVGFNSDHKVLTGRWRFMACEADHS